VLLTNAVDFRGRHVVSDIVDVGGAPVGLVGVVNGDPGLYRRLPFGGTTLTRPNDAVVAEAARLREQGCVTVIALTHQWLRDDRALAQLGVVALVLGGHEHEGYLETDHPTPLAKAPLNATSAVVADVTLSTGPAGVTHVHATARFEAVAGYPEDPAMRAPRGPAPREGARARGAHPAHASRGCSAVVRGIAPAADQHRHAGGLPPARCPWCRGGHLQTAADCAGTRTGVSA
jgi:hypothetical protein